MGSHRLESKNFVGDKTEVKLIRKGSKELISCHPANAKKMDAAWLKKFSGHLPDADLDPLFIAQ